jgi:hypothetical protein
VCAAQLAAVQASDLPRVKERVKDLSGPWQRDGMLVVPHTCLVAVAVAPSDREA